MNWRIGLCLGEVMASVGLMIYDKYPDYIW